MMKKTLRPWYINTKVHKVEDSEIKGPDFKTRRWSQAIEIMVGDLK